MMKCPSCDTDFKSYTAVSLHFRNKHGSSNDLKEIMRKKLVNERYAGTEPRCACGCDQITKYDYMNGYNEFIRGHQARINNNWGHNKDAQEKSQDVRREMHKRGEITIWNKGETKETDHRLIAYGEKGSNTIQSQPDLLEKRSDDMKTYWKSGQIVPLRGPDHSQWKGGTSALQPICRSRVFNAWSHPKLEAASYVCQKCFASDGRGVVVHHDKERFAAILHKAIEIFGDIDPDAPNADFEKKARIADWVVGYHLQNNVSGITLCVSCHEGEHSQG